MATPAGPGTTNDAATSRNPPTPVTPTHALRHPVTPLNEPRPQRSRIRQTNSRSHRPETRPKTRLPKPTLTHARQSALVHGQGATVPNPSWAWSAGAMISTLDDLRIWARTVATGILPDGDALISPVTQKQRLITPPTTIPGAGYGLGIFDVQGWIGHNGSLPGYESLTVYLPSAQATLVVLLNTDIDYKGSEPSTVLGDAITKIVSPDHVFNLPAEPAGR
ncbi:serine hydrolase [Streptomyces sp. NPDC001315]|uniref:serine hydrolase n=1 Tax=Streptomyces sp. NPDC001315 TaxID=3364562 RepID=UPI00368DC9C2